MIIHEKQLFGATFLSNTVLKISRILRRDVLRYTKYVETREPLVQPMKMHEEKGSVAPSLLRQLLLNGGV